MSLFWILVVCVFLPGAQAATIPHLLDSIDITGSGSAGGGKVYTAGGDIIVHYGDSEDESNHTGETHFNYTEDYLPDDPNNAASPIKQAENWTGGLSLSLWKGGTVGIDFDELNDTFENLTSDGVKITLGQDPLKFSYRFARSTINAPFIAGPAELSGALLYQSTFELDYLYKVNEAASIGFTGAYSVFNPSAQEFESLLQRPALANLSDFEDTLQSFEQWKFSTDWTMLWTDTWDSTVIESVSHLIVPANPLFDSNISVGYQGPHSNFHFQVGWEYSYQPGYTQNLGTLAVRWSWDHTEALAKADE